LGNTIIIIVVVVVATLQRLKEDDIFRHSSRLIVNIEEIFFFGCNLKKFWAVLEIRLVGAAVTSKKKKNSLYLVFLGFFYLYLVSNAMASHALSLKKMVPVRS
jgi:hypothetical protein